MALGCSPDPVAPVSPESLLTAAQLSTLEGRAISRSHEVFLINNAFSHQQR